MHLLEPTPAAPGRNPVSGLPTTEQNGFRPQKTILLAEDNDDLRYVMECSLRTMGYLVVACADAHLASTAFHAYPAVDILLTDFEMPSKSGLDLARELTAVRCSLPVMIITGSLLSNAILQEIHDRRWIHVSKPCHLAALESLLKQLLESERSVAA